jgi:hypothetical protein
VIDFPLIFISTGLIEEDVLDIGKVWISFKVRCLVGPFSVGQTGWL